MDDHARRQSWFGLKRFVKRFLALRVPNAIVRLVGRLVPSLRSGRLPAPARLSEVAGRVGGATFVMLDPARCENAKELFWGRGRRPRAHDRLALDSVAVLARESDTFLDVGAYTGLFTLAVTAYAPAGRRPRVRDRPRRRGCPRGERATERDRGSRRGPSGRHRRSGGDDPGPVGRGWLGAPRRSTRRRCASTAGGRSASDPSIPSPP